MGQILFANFLEDKRVYHLAQLFWKRYFRKLSIAQGFTLNEYLHTKDEFDGNPIFNAFIPELNRAIRIIQVDPAESEGSIDVKAWVDKVELPQISQNIPELVIDMVLSRKSKEIGTELINEWLKKEPISTNMIQNILEGKNN